MEDIKGDSDRPWEVRRSVKAFRAAAEGSPGPSGLGIARRVQGTEERDRVRARSSSLAIEREWTRVSRAMQMIAD